MRLPGPPGLMGTVHSSLQLLSRGTGDIQSRGKILLFSLLLTNPEERPEEMHTQSQTQMWTQFPKQWKSRSPVLLLKRESEENEAQGEDVPAKVTREGKHTLFPS